MNRKSAINPKRNENYSKWYNEIIKQADLADHSPTRGCMIIKPWGYAIWENIQKILDKSIKNSGHKNVYFPLLIPLSFFSKEAKHVEGFAKEVAVVTHCKLEKDDEGQLALKGKLEEPFVIRPTSEMIIGDAFSKWINSYRDLPIYINQWANIIRWEMRTRMFLRTTEFLWQEGHTAHMDKKEAISHTNNMLDMYSDFCFQYLAMPVIKGEKTKAETFPGAENTYSIEAMLQDKKALQSGTTHFLGQKFAKALDIKFSDEDGSLKYVYTTSFGVSTRLMGGLIMTHSDDDGLVLPPRIAPVHIVILPIMLKNKEKVLEKAEELKNELEATFYDDKNIIVEIDTRDLRGGEKKWGWVKKGVPILIELGLRDIEKGDVSFLRRDNVYEQNSLSFTKFVHDAATILEDIQKSLLEKAENFLKANTKEIYSKEEFYTFFKKDEKSNVAEGFALSYFCLDEDIEKKIKEDLQVTTRCIPLDYKEKGRCIFTGKENCPRVIFAKAY